MSIPTPHINAKQGDFAETVLMPGDPLRAKVIAETYLKNVKCVNEVRGMLGYTGEYNGKRVSVMGSGMGIPSIGIYSYELFSFYGVENIIRIGSAGGIADGVALYDIVLGVGACTDSNFSHQYKLPGIFAPIASFDLVQKAIDSSKKLDIPVKCGNILSSDVFYDDAQSLGDWRKMGVLAVEMEAAGLYMNAARLGKKALAMCTISDLPFSGAVTTAEERQNSFHKMMQLGLEIA